MKSRWTAGLLILMLIFQIAAADFIKPVREAQAQIQVNKKKTFKVHFIEVGNGDGALLQYGSGNAAKYALIDAGPTTVKVKGSKKTRDVSKNVYRYLKKKGVKKLEFAIMSHPHYDHIGGFIAILKDKKIGIGRIYCKADPVYNHYKGDKDEFKSGIYKKVNKLIKKRKIPTYSPSVGSSTRLGNAKIKFYGPSRRKYKYGRKVNYFDATQINKLSIVCRITFGHNSFLMTGDTQNETEKEMMKNKNLKLGAQVMKVSHHGADDLGYKPNKGKSIHNKFYKRVAPAISVISDGYKNGYKLPSKTVVKELKKKSNVYTTGKNGTVVVTSNGRKLSVATTKGGGDAAYVSKYLSSKKSSRLVKKVTLKNKKSKKIAAVSGNVKSKYKVRIKKTSRIHIKVKAASYNKIYSVRYKLVKKGKSPSKKRWAKGKSVKVRKGFKGKMYIKIRTSIGSTILKSRGFFVGKKKK